MSKQETLPAAPATGTALTEAHELLRLAIDKGVPVEALEKLQGMAERAADRQAAQAFNAAMARFQSTCPAIEKASTAKITTSGGSGYSYRYAELDTIAATIRPILKAEGLAYSWDSVMDGQAMTVTCTLRHIDGHSSSASFTCPTDSKAGMSPAQKNAAALTFARRQSLVQVLGLTMTEDDTDGAGVGESGPMSSAQSDELVELAAKLSEDDYRRFLAWIGSDTAASIPAAQYAKAKKALQAAIAKAAKS